MYPDSWIYRGFTSCNFDLWWKQNGGKDDDLRKIHGFKLIIYAQTTLILNSTTQFCNARSNFDKFHHISCLCAEFAAKHTKAPLLFITRWRMESDFGSWQSPDISCSHLYRGTIAWTPPTAIYREYTVIGIPTHKTALPYRASFVFCSTVSLWSVKKNCFYEIWWFGIKMLWNSSLVIVHCPKKAVTLNHSFLGNFLLLYHVIWCHCL